jgi:hypothetical protein
VNEHKATSARALARRRNHVSISIKGTRTRLHVQWLPHLAITSSTACKCLFTALRVNLDIDEAEDELVLSTAPRPCSTPPKRPSDHA